MNKLFYFLLTMLFCGSVVAQDVDDKKVNFEYIQLPSNPLKLSLKNYQSSVVFEYEPEVKAQKAAYAQKVKAAEDKYAADLAATEAKQKEADALYEKDLAAYNAKSTGGKFANKLLLDEGKPVRKILPQPYKSIPEEGSYQKLFDGSVLASTYLKLDGFNKSAQNAIIVTGLLKGFQYFEPEMKTSTSQVTRNGQTFNETNYYYEVKYKHPMGLKIEVPGEGVVFNEYFDKLNEYKTYTSAKSKDSYFDLKSTISVLEEKAVAENMKYVQSVLTEKYGYPKVKKEIEVSIVEGKKFQYPEYSQAYEAIITGLNQLSADPDKSVASQNLKSAITLWENALKESEPTNKKARINGNVTMATLFNIALVSIYSDDFVKGEIYINKILTSDPSKREARRAEELRNIMKDFKVRYDARQSVK